MSKSLFEVTPRPPSILLSLIFVSSPSPHHLPLSGSDPLSFLPFPLPLSYPNPPFFLHPTHHPVTLLPDPLSFLFLLLLDLKTPARPPAPPLTLHPPFNLPSFSSAHPSTSPSPIPLHFRPLPPLLGGRKSCFFRRVVRLMGQV